MKRFAPIVLLGLLSLPGRAQTRAINLSHDLVPLGIAARNLAPNDPTLDAVPLIQAALDFARRNGTTLINADPGAYYLLSTTAPDRYVNIDGLTDLTLDFQGANLYQANSYYIGLALTNCLRVTLTNFTIDALRLPFTQARLTGVADHIVNYAAMPGWPSPSSFSTTLLPDGTQPVFWAIVFRNGAVVPGTNQLPLLPSFTPGVLQVAVNDAPWTQFAALKNYQPGDTIVFISKGGESPIRVNDSNGVNLTNISVYSAGALAVHLDTTGNSTLDHVQVIPRPNTDRLISANADGLHSSYTLVNNQIRNCYVSHTLDDGIALNSPFLAFVNRQIGKRQIAVTRRYGSTFPNGMYVLFVNPATAETLSGGMIIAQDSGAPVTLTIDRDLPVLQSGFGMIYLDPDNRGNGSIVENNTVEDVLSARGIFLGGVTGVTVRNNTIRRTDCGAIVMHQDLASYPTGPNQDIVISGNDIQGAIGPSAVGTGTVAAIGAIFALTTDPQFNFVPGSPNSNIQIVNNTITNSGRTAIWVNNVASGAIQSNQIQGYGIHPELATWGLSQALTSQLLKDFAQPIVVRINSSNVAVKP